MGQSLCRGDQPEAYKGEPRERGSYTGEVD